MAVDTWTEDRVTVLKKLYADGFSASVIGAQLGLSRNCIIGKAHRLKLLPPRERRDVPKGGRQHVPVEHRAVTKIVRANGNSNAVKRMASIEAAEQYKLRCVEIVPQHVSLADLEGCKYPYGDGPITFCNHPKLAGSSYCTPHNFLCQKKPYIPIRRFVGRKAAA